MGTDVKYKRILLKLSGEALQNKEKDENGNVIEKEELFDFVFIDKIAAVIKKCVSEGVQIGIIVGAGNIWRGREGTDMDRVRADHMGMLATSINALALQDAFIRNGIDTVVMTSVEMKAFAEPFTIRGAISALEDGKVVIFGGGLGEPYFSTDTAAALRAAEINADAILMAKNVDGIYNADPNKVKNAKRYDDIAYSDVISKGLKAIDLTAAAFCLENDILCFAFGLMDPENIYRVITGEAIGTTLHK